VSRILVRDDWYEPVSSRSILEYDFEQSIFRYADKLFPGYWCVPFRASVVSDYGVSQADMVLIDHEFRGWTVVEAELEHHSLTQHVEPQLRRLVNGEYGDQHAEAIHREKPEIDLPRLKGLVRNVDPDFLVVVPKENTEWRATLANLGVRLATVEIFSNHLGNRVVTYAGDMPEGWDDGRLTRLIRDPLLPRAFRLEKPSTLPNSEEVTLLFDGFLTTWRVVRAKKATYILPNGSLDLEYEGSYVISRTTQGSLVIEVDHK
jgi:hypothetical protein